MGIFDLLRKHGGAPKAPKVKAVKGMPPLGVRQPGVGDGRTSTKRGKIKVVNVVQTPKAKHKGGRHK